MRLTWHTPDYATGYDPGSQEHVLVRRLDHGEWEVSTVHVSLVRERCRHAEASKRKARAWLTERYRGSRQ
jgi:hypothetical protein